MVMLLKFLKEAVKEIAGHGGNHKEGGNFQQNNGNVDAGVCHAGDNGQGNNAEHVVDDGGAENGVACLGVELAHFLQGLDRDADGGSGQHNADKYILQERGGQPRFGGPVIEEKRQPCPATQRHNHAD